MEPEENDVMPPLKLVVSGDTCTAGANVMPKSVERRTRIGDSVALNCVHDTYTVPVNGSAPTHSLSLKLGVSSGLPFASTPSSAMIVGSSHVMPPLCDTDSVTALPRLSRENAMFA